MVRNERKKKTCKQGLVYCKSSMTFEQGFQVNIEYNHKKKKRYWFGSCPLLIDSRRLNIHFYQTTKYFTECDNRAPYWLSHTVWQVELTDFIGCREIGGNDREIDSRHTGWIYKILLLLTRWSTVLTTSRFDTCPTSISPISTANFRLSFIAIATTSSGRLMSLNGGLFMSAIATVI